MKPGKAAFAAALLLPALIVAGCAHTLISSSKAPDGAPNSFVWA